MEKEPTTEESRVPTEGRTAEEVKEIEEGIANPPAPSGGVPGVL